MTYTTAKQRSWNAPTASMGNRSGHIGAWSKVEEEWPSPANKAIIDEINSFVGLPADWDSYGANAPDAKVIRCACGTVIGLDQQKITVLRATPGAGNNIELAFRHKDASVVIDLDDEEWQVRVQHNGRAASYHKISPSAANHVHAVLELV